MRRREFIALVGGAAVAWPQAVRGQQTSLPVIGLLATGSPESDAARVVAVRQGLSDTGFVEGQNIVIEYRWAEGRNDRLSALVDDLVRRQVSVILPTGGTPAALAAKAATPAIPIVFVVGADPVTLGLVTSLNRPGGNVTGVTILASELAPKLAELVRELVSTPSTVALLVNPANPASEAISQSLHSAANTLGFRLHVVNASTDPELDVVFETLTQLRAGALVIAPDPFFTARCERLAGLVVHHALPAIYAQREFAAAGGLMSYGGGLKDAYRKAGVYTGRILKGEKPADLPVQQSTKVELVINLKTAKALGLTVPASLLARADEVIE